MDQLFDPLALARCAEGGRAAVQREHRFVPLALFGQYVAAEDAQAGRGGRHFQALGAVGRLAPVFDLLGHVERDADEGPRRTVLRALDHAACQHGAPAAVAAPVARFHVGRPVGQQRLLRRCQHAGQVVGVDEGAHLLDAEAFGPHRQAQHLEGAVAVVHALGDQVVAPDGDVAQFHRQLELRAGVAQRTCQLEDLGVVDHDADRTLGLPLRRVLDLPLRMNPVGAAVGVQHPVALVVATGAVGRIGVGPHAAVFGVDVGDGLVVAWRTALRVEPPEVEHMPVPAADARGNVTLPHPQAAELLRHVQQLGQAGGALFERVRLAGVLQRPQHLARGLGGGDAHPQHGTRGRLQLQLGNALQQLTAQRALQHAACAVARRQRQHIGAQPQARRPLEALVGPTQPTAGVADGEQVVALFEQRRDHIGRRCTHGRDVARVAHGRFTRARPEAPACRSSRR